MRFARPGCFRLQPFCAISARTVFVFAAVLAPLGSLQASDETERVSITPAGPRTPSRTPPPSSSIRLDVKAVLIPVTVTDRAGRPVSNLEKRDFQILENGVKQEIVSVSTNDAPVSMGVIFDSSNSMTRKIEASASAVDRFFTTTVPGDEFLLVRFSDQPHFVSGFTTRPEEISSWLHATRASGWTALNDAIYLGIQKMKGARNGRRVLMVLSDGGDNNSRYSRQELRGLLREADVQIYSISFVQGSRWLEDVSNETGGRTAQVRGLAQLPEAIEKLSREIRSQYVLTYYSANSQNDGKYRKLKVDVGNPTLHVYWRHGYYAPSN